MTKSPKSARVLLVDDDDAFRHVMASELTRRGYSVVAAASGREALEQAARTNPDVTLLDLRLPDLDGIEVLERLRDRNGSGAGVVVLTAHGTIDTAIRAIRLGAHDYLEKPCPIEKLEMAIQKTFEHVRLVRRQRVLEDGYAAHVASGLVGTSAAFVKMLENVTRIARTGATTLILGETGVGKEVVAKLLHAKSPRADGPFVVVDCAALHEELLQSEIFGHELGAFTGATRQKHGLFEVAHGGTIFLDEVGDTSPDIQAKLLRVLETSRFRRLGGTEEVAVDVRVVAATNRNLQQAISRGRFREDLFYRLSTFTVEIPPLRERREDIGLLAEHFTRQFNLKFSVSKHLSDAASDALLQHTWPGNVRELIHVLEQAVALSDVDTVELEDLPASVRAGRESPAIATTADVATLRDIERRHVFSVLERVAGNRAQAAHLLGMSERTFYRLLRKYRHVSAKPQPAPDAPAEKPEP